MGDDVLRRAVNASELPVGLIDLDSLTVQALSVGAAALMGTDPAEAVGRSVLELTDEPDATSDALAVMARGSIDAYEARRRIWRDDGSKAPTRLWVRELGSQGHPGYAMLFVAPEQGAADEPELARIAPAFPEVTLGTTDAAGLLDRVSPEVRGLLGYANGDLEGAPLIDAVHPDDATRFGAAVARSLADRRAVGVTVRLANDQLGWDDVRMVLSAPDDATSDRLGFCAIDDDSPATPAVGTDTGEPPTMVELERGLTRIANEIQALRLAVGAAELPAGDSVPELADLSSRQWEIVTRLVAGQRPPAIARAMFLSPSTVRNHLSAVYRKLGVHSQQELVDRLGRSDELSTPA